MELLSGIREFARVLVLLCQHASSDERAALARAAFYASPHIFWKGASGSKWAALMLALPSLLCEDARPTYQGVVARLQSMGCSLYCLLVQCWSLQWDLCCVSSLHTLYVDCSAGGNKYVYSSHMNIH